MTPFAQPPLLAAILAQVAPKRKVSSAPDLATPAESHGRIWIIVNPTKPLDYAEFCSRIEQLCLAMAGQLPLWIETTALDPGTGQAITALKNRASLVIAAGGDGTVRAVAAGMAHSGIPLGIIPVGTGNLLARNLRLPFNLESALRVALAGQGKLVDVAWLRIERTVNVSGLPTEGTLLSHAGASAVRSLPPGVVEPKPDEYAYLVIAGLGFDGATMQKTSSRLKRTFGWPAYVLSALKSLNAERIKATVTIHFPPGQGPKPRRHRWRRTIPRKVSEAVIASQTIGDEHSPATSVRTEGSWEMSVLRARTVLFANCGELPFVLLAPDAAIDDGFLDVIAIDTQAGLFGWANLAIKVLSQGIGLPAYNTGHDTGQIAFRQTDRVRVDTNRAVPVQVDGDVIGTARTVIARADKHSLLLHVPTNSKTTPTRRPPTPAPAESHC